MKQVVITPVDENIVNVYDVEGDYFGFKYDKHCAIINRESDGNLQLVYMRTPIAFSQCDHKPRIREITEFIVWLHKEYAACETFQFDSYGEMLVWLSEDGKE